MHITCKRFSNWLHLSLLRDRCKLIFPDKSKYLISGNRLFSGTLLQYLKEICKGCNLFSKKNTAIIRKFFQSYNNWVLNDCCVFNVIYNILSSILVSKKKLCEWGLWNNSWVKNLPICPLAPRRKTPGHCCSPHLGLPGRAKTFDLLFIIRFSMLLLLLLFREWDNIKLRCFKIIITPFLVN